MRNFMRKITAFCVTLTLIISTSTQVLALERNTGFQTKNENKTITVLNDAAKEENDAREKEIEEILDKCDNLYEKEVLKVLDGDMSKFDEMTKTNKEYLINYRIALYEKRGIKTIRITESNREELIKKYNTDYHDIIKKLKIDNSDAIILLTNELIEEPINVSVSDSITRSLSDYDVQYFHVAHSLRSSYRNRYNTGYSASQIISLATSVISMGTSFIPGCGVVSFIFSAISFGISLPNSNDILDVEGFHTNISASASWTTRVYQVKPDGDPPSEWALAYECHKINAKNYWEYRTAIYDPILVEFIPTEEDCQQTKTQSTNEYANTTVGATAAVNAYELGVIKATTTGNYKAFDNALTITQPSLPY